MAEIVKMPKLGFDMAEGTLVRWVIQEGESVTSGAILAEIETDKATVEVEATQVGILRRHLVSEGAVVPVNSPIAVIGLADENIDTLEAATAMPSALKSGGKIEPPTKAEVEIVQKATPTSSVEAVLQLPGVVRASPLARRMAEEMGLDLSKVKGTGPEGRITKKDIESFSREKPLPPTDKTLPAPQPPPAVFSFPPTYGLPAPETISLPLSRLRAIIGKRMVEAKQQIPHFYITSQYDVKALVELRKKINEFLPDDQKISINDFIIKAAALGLMQFPNLNASFQGDRVFQHGPINIGIAVAVEGGLLTVVCKDVDRKPLRQIAIEVREMANRARSGKVRPEDIEGSTFSVSNLGMYEVENFAAIINPPEAAILAVSTANQVPIFENGSITPGWRMKVTISVDHRVSDGAEAARYLQALKNYIEEPLKLLL